MRTAELREIERSSNRVYQECRAKKGERGIISSAVGLLSLVPLFLVFLLPSVSAAAWTPEEVLKAYLKDNYPWRDVEISDLAIDGTIPAEQPAKILVEKGLPGRTVFSLEFENAGRLTATANVRAFDTIVLSRRAYKKGYTLQKDDVYTMLMDVQRIPANALGSVESAVGKSLSRTIMANTPVGSGMLQEGRSIKRGKRVTLIIEGAGFTITTAGEIKENGSVGSAIKAINASSKKIVAGLLIDENTVKVDL
ncbi:MAG TPA: flagellar basal body P-ring formation chaperone FlgA [Thermodesulfovibrionales bacterium]|nr:flagellar basal body P-ring formation chaperone FlgA [Thermodesulfovibrionales bacterium]